jgi:hypothetical protein
MEYRYLLDCRTMNGKIQYLVDWKPTWVDESDIKGIEQAMAADTEETKDPGAKSFRDASSIEPSGRRRSLSVGGELNITEVRRMGKDRVIENSPKQSRASENITDSQGNGSITYVETEYSAE